LADAIEEELEDTKYVPFWRVNYTEKSKKDSLLTTSILQFSTLKDEKNSNSLTFFEN